MLIVADYRLSQQAFGRLCQFGEVVLLQSADVYDALSGHPDVFLCRLPHGVVAAPNTPVNVLEALARHAVPVVAGSLPARGRYPATARYNAVVANGLLIHNLRHTDEALAHAARQFKFLHVNQGYSACNLISLPDGSFISSDQGIVNCLTRFGIESHYVEPQGITLPGFHHGFLGGCAGWMGNLLVFTGNLSCLAGGDRLADLLRTKNVEWISLSDELHDVGGVMFFQQNGSLSASNSIVPIGCKG